MINTKVTVGPSNIHCDTCKYFLLIEPDNYIASIKECSTLTLQIIQYQFVILH